MSRTTAPTGRALVLSYSNIASDPRVRRQIAWLSDAGWTVDTIGLGEHPGDDAHDHYELLAPQKWLTSKPGLVMAHTFLPNPAIFKRQVLARVPAKAKDRVYAGEYDLMIFNELEFSPWAEQIRGALAERAPRMHLDLHEYHNVQQRRQTLGGRITGAHYRWLRASIGSRAFDSRTVVNEPIGSLYLDEYEIPPMHPSRNTPAYVEQSPSPVDAGEIRLLFHGLASLQRGFAEILEAMRLLDERFSMTFMLMPNPTMRQWLADRIAAHPAKDRIRIVPPAPMPEIAQRINGYDLEIIFYQPTSHNLEYALPNKFFESIQGRLGVVVADGKTMAPIVREWGNGVVVDGFGGDDLAAALGALSAADVARIKQASHAAARELNAEAEGRSFIRAVLGV